MVNLIKKKKKKKKKKGGKKKKKRREKKKIFFFFFFFFFILLTFFYIDDLAFCNNCNFCANIIFPLIFNLPFINNDCGFNLPDINPVKSVSDIEIVHCALVVVS